MIGVQLANVSTRYSSHPQGKGLSYLQLLQLRKMSLHYKNVYVVYSLISLQDLMPHNYSYYNTESTGAE